MKVLHHGSEIVERWFALSLAEQLGNIGSEVSRTLSWRSRSAETAQRALERALELIDLTLDDPRHRSSPPRLREICRAREVLLDYVAGPNSYGSTDATLRRYFDVFAVAANIQRTVNRGSATRS
jgi:methylmalonyl-CoA mutase cobalamin-binding subunit